jgi:DNA-binding PadR family transcriptional regulator
MSTLTRLTYEILLALADRDRHGYGIIKEIEDRSGVAGVPSTGAMYLALQRMEADGLIAEASEKPAGADGRRRYYRITPKGRQVAEAESRQLAELVADARSRSLLVGGGS